MPTYFTPILFKPQVLTGDAVGHAVHTDNFFRGFAPYAFQGAPPMTPVPGQRWPRAASNDPRAQTSVTSAITQPSAVSSASMTLARAFRLFRITTSAPCRFRMYTTDAKMGADASRALGVDPTGDHGLILEFASTPSLLSADLSPTVDGFDGKTPPNGIVPVSITNLGASATTITCTLIWISEE